MIHTPKILISLETGANGSELLTSRIEKNRSTRTAASDLRVESWKIDRGTSFGSFIANNSFESKHSSKEALNEYAEVNIISKKNCIKNKTKSKCIITPVIKEFIKKIDHQRRRKSESKKKKKNIKIILNVY